MNATVCIGGVRFVSAAATAIGSLDPLVRERVLHVLRETAAVVAIGISGLDFGSCALHTSIGGIRVLYSVDERRRELLVHAVSEPMARAG